jgi:hypothetical protein
MEQIKQKTEYEILFEEVNQELAEIFGFVLENIKIVVANDRIEYEKILGRKTKSWQIGEASIKDTILILSPESWEKDAPMHKKGEERSLIKHELIHLYEKDLCDRRKIKLPHWINEGIAVVFSGQLAEHSKNKDSAESFFKNINIGWSKLVDLKVDPYGVSGFFIDYLLNKTMSLDEIFILLEENDGKFKKDDIEDFINKYYND